MSEVSASMVKELREKTGAGMMDCKKALAESGGSMEQAIEVLRKMGLKDIGKRQGKTAAEGTIGMYMHTGDQVAAVVELNCETDFVARGDEFKTCARDIALHVAAMKPQWVSETDVPQEIIDKEKEILIEQLSADQKSKADKIIPGRIKKFFEENCLLNQIFVKDDSGKLTISQLVENLGVKTGEKVVVRRFFRFEVGEGIEKKQADLLADVAATIAGG